MNEMEQYIDDVISGNNSPTGSSRMRSLDAEQSRFKAIKNSLHDNRKASSPPPELNNNNKKLNLNKNYTRNMQYASQNMSSQTPGAPISLLHSYLAKKTELEIPDADSI